MDEVILIEKKLVRLLLSVKTITGFSAPQVKCEKCSRAKYSAKNSLQYVDIFN